MDKEKLRELILQYSFYDEQHKLNVVINTDYLKDLFEADNILLEEIGHR